MVNPIGNAGWPPPTDAADPSPSRGASVRGDFRWAILALLFCATTVNYMDRQIIAVLKAPLMRELHWRESDYARIVNAFQLAYALGWLILGRLVDRLGVRIGMALVVAIWSLAAAGHSLVRSVAAFCVARFCLGFGEGGAWPACVKAVGEWFPPRERAVGSGIVNAGSAVGATLTPALVPFVLRFVSWPFAFLVTSALDLAWLCAWLAVYESPDRHPRVSARELAHIRGGQPPPRVRVPWLSLLRHRQTWGFALPKALTDPVWWFYLFWVPGFLAGRYHLDLADLAAPVTMIYAMADVGGVGGGWLSMALVARGASVNVARKSVMLACALIVVPVSLVSRDIGLWPSALLIGLAAAAHQGFSANLFTVATDTVPGAAVSSLAGLGGMMATVASLFAARFVGFLLDTTGSYAVPFAAASCSYLAAFALLQILLPHLEPMRSEEASA